jgi:hypothetical protein
MSETQCNRLGLSRRICSDTATECHGHNTDRRLLFSDAQRPIQKASDARMRKRELTSVRGSGLFRLPLARSIILQPGSFVHVLFPRRDPGVAVMLFHFVLVVFSHRAPE